LGTGERDAWRTERYRASEGVLGGLFGVGLELVGRG